MTADALRAQLDGDLVMPDDAGYDEARAIFNAMHDRRPALIARCTSTADVVAAVNHGREPGSRSPCAAAATAWPARARARAGW